MTDLEKFLAAYIETALWSSSCEQEPHPDRSLQDAGYDRDSIDPATLVTMRAECEAFLEKARQLVEDDDPRFNPANGTRLEHAAHDFWLTRNGHGAGFWDGDWPKHGDELTELAHAAGERNLYVGDDGRIYCCQG